MCGIVGVARFQGGGLLDSNVRTFHDMLIAGQVRGMDGTGIVRISKKYRVELRKIRGNAIDLLRADGVSKWLQRAAPDCDLVLIGHNRYATTANGTNAHAHPFQQAHITLVHNGTLVNHDDLVKGDQKFEVDSDALANAIAKLGVKEALLKASGAISIVYYDRKEKTLNFYRNHQRPMFIHYSLSSRELLFGSEKKMIEWAGDRNTMNGVFPQELPVYTLTRFNVADGTRMPDIRIDPWEHNRAANACSGYPNSAACEMADSFNDFGMASEQLALPGPKGAGVEEVNEPEPDIPVSSTLLHRHLHSAYTAANTMIKVQHVDELFGYRKDMTIQWAAIDSFKTSEKQDQWKVVGCVIDPKDDGTMAKLEIHCFVKGKEKAQELQDAHWVKAKVRSLQKPKAGLSGAPIIWVSDNEVFMGAEETKEGEVLPPETPVQVETKSAIIDLKGSSYDPSIKELPPKKTSLIKSAAIAFLGQASGSEKLH